jgi:hypothetical protein
VVGEKLIAQVARLLTDANESEWSAFWIAIVETGQLYFGMNGENTWACGSEVSFRIL